MPPTPTAPSSHRSRSTRFRDRREAGRELAAALRVLPAHDPIVVALPRGGVPVAFEVARALGAPLDIALVRKLGAPMEPELGVGAIVEGGHVHVDTATVEALGISRAELERVIARETDELERRRRAYRGDRPPVAVGGRTVVLVDDGLATGVTATAAARALRARGAREVILAVPVCPTRVGGPVRAALDRLVCLRSPEPFLGVGDAYEDFAQTSDDEVVGLLAAAGEHGTRQSARLS